MITEEEFCLRVGIEHRTLWVWLDEGWLAPRRDDAGLSCPRWMQHALAHPGPAGEPRRQ